MLNEVLYTLIRGIHLLALTDNATPLNFTSKILYTSLKKQSQLIFNKNEMKVSRTMQYHIGINLTKEIKEY